MVKNMAQEIMVSNAALSAQQINTGALLLGAGLALTSMILIPCLGYALRLKRKFDRGFKNCIDESIQQG